MWTFLNDDKKLIRIGGRKTLKSITPEELKKQFKAFRDKCGEHPFAFLESAAFKKDRKIEVSHENFNFGFTEFERFKEPKISITPNKKIPYIPFRLGGDWECPVYGMIYYDGKGIRFYYPSYGNSINLFTKAAFGNAYDMDIEEAIKLVGAEFEGEEDVDIEVAVYSHINGGNKKLTWENVSYITMVEDFESRVEVL